MLSHTLSDDKGDTNTLFLSQETVLSDSYLKHVIQSRIHPKYGKCIVYSPKKHSITKGLTSFKIQASQNFSLRVFIHASDQFWDATNREMGYKMDPFEKATAQVYYSDIKTLQDFSFIRNIPTCSYESYDKCVEESVYKR